MRASSNKMACLGSIGPFCRHTDVMKADVVVIGAGALGLSTALHCAIAGRSVVVVERDTAGSHASGRAAGLFKSVQTDELRTGLARRSIAKALKFGDWAGVELDVTRSGSYLIARTAAHQELLRTEQRQSREWGVDIRAANAGEVTANVSYYQESGSEFALWCPEDVYIAEPTDLIRPNAAACRLHGPELLQPEPGMAFPRPAGRAAGARPPRRPPPPAAVSTPA